MTTTDQPGAITAAVATRDNSPAGMVRAYRTDFASVMPTHIKPDAWVRIAVGALKKGKKVQVDRTTSRFELEIAAENNPGVFLAALLDAARLGLEPGTEQYYLTPRKVRGQLEILGVVGYQGIIELMYRAGAVASVVAEVVYAGDSFAFQPGIDEVPRHVIDWDADDRGQLRLVYAYARMRDGATSKVVVLTKHDIARIKESSQGANSDYSPWVKHPAAMWLKSAVRQLAKWVPTSSEYVLLDKPLAAAAAAVETAPGIAALPGVESVDRSTGEIFDNEVVEGVLDDEPPADVEDPPDERQWEDLDVAQPGGGGRR